MAVKKRTRSPRKHSRGLLFFPEAKGKIVERVELDREAESVGILFQDRTVLSFHIDPRVFVFPELSDWKTGNWKGIKRWPAVQSRGPIVRWP
jgi:hypothetical protein